MVLLIYLITILETMVLTFEQKESSKQVTKEMAFLKWPVYFGNILLLLDIVFNFFTGYYDREIKMVRLSHNDIARNYLQKKFWIHAIFSIPWLLIAHMYERVTNRTQLLDTYYELRDYFSIASFTRVLRYEEISDFLGFYENCSIKYKTFWKLLKLLIYTTTLYHLGACLLLNIYSLTEDDPYSKVAESTQVVSWIVHDHFFVANNGSVTQKYMRCLFRASCIMSLYGDGIEVNTSPTDRNLTILFRIIGVAHLLFIVSNMSLIVHSRYSGERKLQTLEQYVKEMSRHKRLPPSTTKRMLQYFQFKCEGRFFNETKLMGMLSTQLQRDIQNHCFKRLVDAVPMFQDLPKQAKEQLISHLVTDVYLPRDIIIKSGTEGSEMFFLSIGVVTVKLDNEPEFQLRDGEHFAEDVLVSEGPLIRMEQVVALEPCEMQILYKKDFLEVMEPYPLLLRSIKDSFGTRENDSQLEEQGLNDDFS